MSLSLCRGDLAFFDVAFRSFFRLLRLLLLVSASLMVTLGALGELEIDTVDGRKGHVRHFLRLARRVVLEREFLEEGHHDQAGLEQGEPLADADTVKGPI